MRKLNKLQQILYYAGAILILVGAVLNPVTSDYAPYVYSLGALLFASMQIYAGYEGDNFVIRRLRRQQIIGALLLVLSGAAMFGKAYNIPYTKHNEWMVVMMVAALLELYTAFRLPVELKKEEEK